LSPRVRVRDTRWETIFTFVYWKESFKMKHLANFKFGTNISCMMGIQIYSNEGPNPLQRGIITKRKKKNGVGSFKYFLLMNHSTIKAQINTSAS
jgi:hypothetical protein